MLYLYTRFILEIPEQSEIPTHIGFTALRVYVLFFYFIYLIRIRDRVFGCGATAVVDRRSPADPLMDQRFPLYAHSRTLVRGNSFEILDCIVVLRTRGTLSNNRVKTQKRSSNTRIRDFLVIVFGHFHSNSAENNGSSRLLTFLTVNDN